MDGNLEALVDSVADNSKMSIAVKEMLIADILLMRDKVAISVTREQLHAQSVVCEYIGRHYSRKNKSKRQRKANRIVNTLTFPEDVLGC